MGQLKTVSEVIEEGKKAFLNRQGDNPYLPQTWAYKAWQEGYRRGMAS